MIDRLSSMVQKIKVQGKETGSVDFSEHSINKIKIIIH